MTPYTLRVRGSFTSGLYEESKDCLTSLIFYTERTVTACWSQILRVRKLSWYRTNPELTVACACGVQTFMHFTDCSKMHPCPAAWGWKVSRSLSLSEAPVDAQTLECSGHQRPVGMSLFL